MRLLPALALAYLFSTASVSHCQDSVDQPEAVQESVDPATPETTLRIVPSVVGKRPEIARQILRMADFDSAFGVFYIAPQNWRDDIRPNVIYMQSPQPKTATAEDSTVAGWVFARAKENQDIVQMPDLRASAAADALAALHESGLKQVRIQTGDASGRQRSEPNGHATVSGQYPQPGQSVYIGTSVFLVLSDGRLD